MSLLDDYISEERTNLSEVINSSTTDCYSPDVCATSEIARSEYKLEVCFSKFPIVHLYKGNIPVITGLNQFYSTYHQYIEMIFENNNMFKSWTSPSWQTEGPFTGLSFEKVQRDIEAVVTYGFNINPGISPRSVMRFVSQLYQIPLSGQTTVSISPVDGSHQSVFIHIADNYRGQMFYDSLKRMDLLKNLIRTFSTDERKTNFHRLQTVIGRYRIYGRPDGCVNFSDICEISERA